jgi:hypothetical protein
MNSLFSRKTNKVEDLRAEMKRRASNKQSMLRAFEQRGTLTTTDLLSFGPGLSSRLHELRKSGFKIITQYEKPGEYSYHFLGKVEGE